MKLQLNQMSKDKDFTETWLDNEVTNMYFVSKVTREKIDNNYPYFRYVVLKEEIMNDPEYKKQNSETFSSNKYKSFR